MTDIIIPAYKAQGFIDRLLSSIAMQILVSDIKVIIVNDDTEGNYSENIRRFPNLDITELSYGENRGPGYARQYGIEHSSGDYIIFADTDDTFYDSESVYHLIKPLEEDANTISVWSPFKSYNSELRQSWVQADDLHIWVHGKAYRRSFLEHYGVRFSPTSYAEDTGFNYQIMLLGTEERFIAMTKEPTYCYCDDHRENRINDKTEALLDTQKGIIDNAMFAVNNILPVGGDADIAKNLIVQTLVRVAVYYDIYYMNNLYKIESRDKEYLSWMSEAKAFLGSDINYTEYELDFYLLMVKCLPWIESKTDTELRSKFKIHKTFKEFMEAVP